jgi:hypothetical protein
MRAGFGMRIIISRDGHACGVAARLCREVGSPTTNLVYVKRLASDEETSP